MKVLCRREELLSAFQQASVAVPARDVKPVLRNVKAIAEEDRCTLLATDLELGARLEVAGLTVEEPAPSWRQLRRPPGTFRSDRSPGCSSMPLTFSTSAARTSPHFPCSTAWTSWPRP